ncbi:MAG: DNA polymerase III subunit alpha [Flavobacteriales bacterium]|nr:DNA polymerase III subunit alpha [Flavobacteriales bacterium]
MSRFAHLHVHTQYSLLDGAAPIDRLFKKAVENNMPALAITDHGNMFGVFSFMAEAEKYRINPADPQDKRLKVKPIIGCEFYLVENRFQKQFTRERKDKRYHQLFLAKNEEGYRNLSKLCSLGFIEGYYQKYPRIDKELILQYHTGLMATSCCLGAMIPQKILHEGEEAAEVELRWWLDVFGEDYFIELQRHGLGEQDQVNEVLMRLARKYRIPMLATNDAHYVEQSDANAHDILLCINTGEKLKTPKIDSLTDDDVPLAGRRFAFPNDNFFFKTPEEMARLFQDVPEAIENTLMLADRVDTLDLKRDVLLPAFPLPAGFNDQDSYLEFLTFEGARRRYGEITEEVENRLRDELTVIRLKGFAGYFLIVQDFIRAARDLGVFVGPGRGSAAGSCVAYCLGITNIDPIRYGLLFERFLNEERNEMPDIDTDFDDEGRQRVIDYVVEKYGRNQVAQIVTFQTLAARNSIKDVARVMDLPLATSDMLAKLVPERPGITLDRVLNAPLMGEKSLTDPEKENLRSDELTNVKKLREFLAQENSPEGQVLKQALLLEGSVRGTGVHAAGVIIAPRDLTDLMPLAVAKDADLLVSQFEGEWIEKAGVIKMDFLGLRTLTVMKEAVRMIQQNRGVEIRFEDLPLDDPDTFALFQRGDTAGIFQFEKPHVIRILREMKPTCLEDLIALNALNRPGPMKYIPAYIARKHGKEPVTYDLPELEPFLKETYGITVYQEQVMLIAQKLAGFSKADADKLRKAMGKKNAQVLKAQHDKFLRGAIERGYPQDKLEKIWSDWEEFAKYAFNKSHSACYAYIAYYTAYLKAHYLPEFTAATLNSFTALEDITPIMADARRLGVEILGPDINESGLGFTVNAKMHIRFGLNKIKGCGDGVVEAILEERQKGGPFRNIFDLAGRVSNRALNKRVLEAMAYAGAFDCFEGVHRAQYFQPDDKGQTVLEKALRYGQAWREAKSSAVSSLFGETLTDTLPEPVIPSAPAWDLLFKLNLEKEYVGMYLSEHPLDRFALEIEVYGKNTLQHLDDIKPGQKLQIPCIITRLEYRTGKSGKPFAVVTLEDYETQKELMLFERDLEKVQKYLQVNNIVLVTGEGEADRGREGQTRFVIRSMETLVALKERGYKKLLVETDLCKVNENLTLALSQLLQPGNTSLEWLVTDSQLGHLVLTRDEKIHPTPELLKYLREEAEGRVTVKLT